MDCNRINRQDPIRQKAQTDNVRLRPMTDLDLTWIAEIERASFTDPWPQDAFLSELSNRLAHYLILENKHAERIAYGGFWHVVDEAHITNIAVDPAWKSKGYGKCFMRFFLVYMQKLGIRAVTLEVRASNQVAMSLYRSFDFKQEGRRKAYYADGEDALILWKTL